MKKQGDKIGYIEGEREREREREREHNMRKKGREGTGREC